MTADDPPPAVHRATSRITGMARVVPLDNLAALVIRWRDARCRAARLRATVDAAEVELLAALDGADVGTVDGQPAVRREVEERPRLDIAKLRAEHPGLAARYAVAQQRERLRIVKPRPTPRER